MARPFVFMSVCHGFVLVVLFDTHLTEHGRVLVLVDVEFVSDRGSSGGLSR